MPDLTQFPNPGGQYTMTFEPSGLLSYLEHPDVGALNNSVQSISYIASPVVTLRPVTGVGGTDYYDLSFTYVGDGSDAFGNIAGDVLAAFDGSTSVSWDFIGFGTPQPNQSLNLPLPSSSSLWAIALVALLAVFVLSGGASATRAALA